MSSTEDKKRKSVRIANMIAKRQALPAKAGFVELPLTRILGFLCVDDRFSVAATCKSSLEKVEVYSRLVLDAIRGQGDCNVDESFENRLGQSFFSPPGIDGLLTYLPYRVLAKRAAEIPLMILPIGCCPRLSPSQRLIASDSTADIISVYSFEEKRVVASLDTFYLPNDDSLGNRLPVEGNFQYMHEVQHFDFLNERQIVLLIDQHIVIWDTTVKDTRESLKLLYECPNHSRVSSKILKITDDKYILAMVCYGNQNATLHVMSFDPEESVPKLSEIRQIDLGHQDEWDNWRCSNAMPKLVGVAHKTFVVLSVAIAKKFTEILYVLDVQTAIVVDAKVLNNRWCTNRTFHTVKQSQGKFWCYGKCPSDFEMWNVDPTAGKLSSALFCRSNGKLYQTKCHAIHTAAGGRDVLHKAVCYDDHQALPLIVEVTTSSIITHDLSHLRSKPCESVITAVKGSISYGQHDILILPKKHGMTKLNILARYRGLSLERNELYYATENTLEVYLLSEPLV